MRLPAGAVARAGLVLLGLGVGAYVLWHLREVLFLLLLALLLATAIEPLVDHLRRGPFSRGVGILVVYTAIVLAIGLPIVLIAPSLTAEASAFFETLPDRLEALRHGAEQLPPGPLRLVASDLLAQLAVEIQQPRAPGQRELVEVGATLVHTLVSVLTVFVLAFYWLIERARLKRAVLRLVGPKRAREVNTVWMEVEEKLGGWVRGQVVLMLSIGAMTGAVFLLLGLPYPVLLAVFAALAELIPIVGPFLAFAPAVLILLAADIGRLPLLVGCALLVQFVEGNILVPRVMGHAVGVSPLTVLLGILVGAALAGVPGALIAVPVAGAAQVILAHVLGLEGSAQAAVHQRAQAAPVSENGLEQERRERASRVRHAPADT